MTKVPHVLGTDWDFADRLQHLAKATNQNAYYTCDSSEQRVRKVYERVVRQLANRVIDPVVTNRRTSGRR